MIEFSTTPRFLSSIRRRRHTVCCARAIRCHWRLFTSGTFILSAPVRSLSPNGTMPKKAAIVKNCPKCEQNSAVASKTCKCGYSFFNARRSVGRPPSFASPQTSPSSRNEAGSSGYSGSRSRSQQQSAAAADASTSAATNDGDESRRRTSRVRREKPNYYDSQEFDKKNKKKKERRVRKWFRKCLIIQLKCPSAGSPQVAVHRLHGQKRDRQPN